MILSRLKKRLRPEKRAVDENAVNFSHEHVALAQTIGRRRRIIKRIWDYLPHVRLLLAVVGTLWLFVLPYEGLWKNTYIDEHAIQPSQVTMYYDWANVHTADRYLGQLERLVDNSQAERSTYLQDALSAAGLHTGNTTTATFARVTPPRSAGTEVILLASNWVSRDGRPNLRGIAMLLSLGDFLRGQNHWAFDIVLVVGEGYLDGLEGFMLKYDELFPGLIWTALNLDYPGHSFDHIGLFYEGVNGRLPNQDMVNTVAHVARWAGGVPTRLHDVPDEPISIGGPGILQPYLGNYLSAAKHLWEHARYMALGRASGGHGVLARHRIDSLTVYCPDASGPHGFHTLGRTLESTLRSLNNILERLHASYFFYLLPKPEKFIPVGNYLPAAVLFGASVTLGGFDCPTPIEGILYLILPALITVLGWILHTPLVSFAGLLLPRPKGAARRSLVAFTHLFYGSLIPTLAMVNFPQAILLAGLVVIHLAPSRWVRLAALGIHPILLTVDLRSEWEVLGNLAWVGILWIWVPLAVISATI